jgi:hypothetical protein
MIFKILDNYFINQYKKQYIKILDKQENPQSASDWRVRSKSCIELIKSLKSELVNKKVWEQDVGKKKIAALEIISNESYDISILKELESKNKKLKHFSHLDGHEFYLQIGGKEWAKSVLFYKNKSRIIVEINSEKLIFEVKSDGVGRWYFCNHNKLIYEITLGIKSPEELLIQVFESINPEELIEEFIIELQLKV